MTSVPADAAPAIQTGIAGAEQSRARYPDDEGFVEREGQRLFYEIYGDGDETVFLLPTWSLVHSRHWKMQIPYFARHFRVLVMDGLGNGRADRDRDRKRRGQARQPSVLLLDVRGCSLGPRQPHDPF